jgi:farnesyl diphosphate synthase
MAKTTTLKEFESVFPKLVEDILDHAKQYKLPEEFVSWYKAVRNLPLLSSHKAY